MSERTYQEEPWCKYIEAKKEFERQKAQWKKTFSKTPQYLAVKRQIETLIRIQLVTKHRLREMSKMEMPRPLIQMRDEVEALYKVFVAAQKKAASEAEEEAKKEDSK